jgi:hypothetical protein
MGKTKKVRRVLRHAKSHFESCILFRAAEYCQHKPRRPPANAEQSPVYILMISEKSVLLVRNDQMIQKRTLHQRLGDRRNGGHHSGSELQSSTSYVILQHPFPHDTQEFVVERCRHNFHAIGVLVIQVEDVGV